MAQGGRLRHGRGAGLQGRGRRLRRLAGGAADRRPRWARAAPRRRRGRGPAARGRADGSLSRGSRVPPAPSLRVAGGEPAVSRRARARGAPTGAGAGSGRLSHRAGGGEAAGADRRGPRREDVRGAGGADTGRRGPALVRSAARGSGAPSHRLPQGRHRRLRRRLPPRANLRRRLATGGGAPPGGRRPRSPPGGGAGRAGRGPGGRAGGARRGPGGRAVGAHGRAPRRQRAIKVSRQVGPSPARGGEGSP